ncbi:PREDICTED: uncharacterized protein C17orf53 homolog [Elephantulus edwardii]|uniref:uncharacterized protein C17orf53 homolog n=1 Tax=Elephantulus edwardii TaxID=28737 RepID=UPI0003F081D9|nr:PREDICTED: uncharacterized protein C17orf53 homolog [Elephantulus edwardii]
MVMWCPRGRVSGRLIPEPRDPPPPPSASHLRLRELHSWWWGGGKSSSRAGAACSLQKLFAVEEEFEDEDFLSAVEDAENQFAGSLPVNAGCLRSVLSRSPAMVQAQSSTEWTLSHPTGPPESAVPALGRRLPISSMSEAVRGPVSTDTAPLRPISTSGSCSGNQRRVEVLNRLARPQSSAPCPLPPLENQQQLVGGLEGPGQDEFDQVLASMELEGPGTELELGLSSEATGTLPTWQGEDLTLAKKARVAELSRSCPKGPMLALHSRHHGLASVQGQPLDTAVHCRTPQRHLRPGAIGNRNLPAASSVPTQQGRWGVSAKGPPLPAPQPLETAGSPIQCSPQNRFSRQPLQSSRACLSGKPRFPGPRTPSLACSASSRTHFGFSPRGLLEPQAPAASAALQTPLVTNHLVQLVTATNRTPQPHARTATPAKARRFPGPAGLLPHQHSGKNLEEIMVSTPQTPAHGALAKLRTEVVASSQTSLEDDFGRGPWLTMKSSLGLDERDPSCFLCTYSIIMVLRKAALKQLPRNKVPKMAVMIKSLTRSTMDASVVFKDPTGEMQGTIHRVLLETRQNELKPGSVLLLKQIGVFSPSLRNHYLNVTPNNLVHIYSPDSGDGNFLKSSEPLPQELGSFHGNLQRAFDGKSNEDLRTAQNPEASEPPEEELSEADDLDGLLSELPEDFFSGTSSWNCPKAGHPL